MTSIDGKICVVTGSTSGIGRAIAFRLAELGGRVVLVARDRGRAELVRQDIAARAKSTAVDIVLADLSSQASLRAGVAALQAQHPRIDVLVNQAGLVQSERTVTVDGLETMFAVNHLAYFMMTNLLRPQLAAGRARVLNVTGGIEAAGTIDFDDLQRARKFGWFKTLAQSKLANVLFTYEAARRFAEDRIVVNCLNPGGVKTALGQNTGGLPRLMMTLGALFFASPEKAARNFVQPLVSPELAQLTGKYFAPDGRTLARSSARSHDAALAERLWTVSAALTSRASV